MKVCITARFSLSEESREAIEKLSRAVQAAGMEDFCFVRDVEHYQKTFDDPRDLWARTKQEIAACDALLVDVSDGPTGGRVIEVGMAFARDMPIFVIAKAGTQYKEIFEGVATTVIFYDDYDDIVAPLKDYAGSTP